jgi:hypothetical protein
MTALTVIDVQKAIDHSKWVQVEPRTNPDSYRNIARLLPCWRVRECPSFTCAIIRENLIPRIVLGRKVTGFKPEVAPLLGKRSCRSRLTAHFLKPNLNSDCDSPAVSSLWLPV